MTAPTLHMRLVAMAASLIGAVRNLDLVSVSHSHADHVDALRDALDMVHEANVTCNHRHMVAMQALDDTRGELAALLMTIQTSKALRVPDVSSSWKTDAQPPHALLLTSSDTLIWHLVQRLHSIQFDLSHQQAKPM